MTTGDKVKYVSGLWGDTSINPLWGGKHGEIAGIVTYKNQVILACNYSVKWDNGQHNSYNSEDIELLESLVAQEINKMMEELIEEII